MTTFISTPRRRPVLHRCLLALALSTATVLPAMASPFTLQSNTVILEEREGRTSFNITNPGNQPILLLSKVENLDDQAMAGNVLVTPAVTRIDPGQSQIINFALKKGVTLDREYMLRASFEGVAQKAEQGMRMPIRQQIGFIIQPRSVAVELRPWQDLRFQADGRQLTVRNSGRHVIRMGPTLTLDSGAVGSLPHPYLMPGEEVAVSFDAPVSGAEVQIVPLSRYGFANPTQRVPLR